MSTANPRNDAPVPHSDPIPIAASPYRTAHHSRARSASLSSSSSGSFSELSTPGSGMQGSNPTIPSPTAGSSPILSYFFAQPPSKSPTSSPGTFPLRKYGSPAMAPPVFEEDEEPPAASHARRASMLAAGRFGQSNVPPTSMPDPSAERGVGLLRRLSLSGASFVRPAPTAAPPNSAVSPSERSALPPSSGTGFTPGPGQKGRRSTLSVDHPKTRRAPSPMGERILKGHFDGFN